MISGRQALGQIEQAVAQLRREEARLDGALHAAGDEAARLRLQRMEAFRELARLKLDAMTAQGFAGELDQAERQALALLERRRQALESLTERRRQAEAAQRQREAERHARAADLEEALKAIGALRAKVEADAPGAAPWGAQRARIEAAETIAGEAQKKAERAEADRQEKGRPYEADPLFMYLWGKKFGTAEDRSGPFVRFFDRKVARLVGYDKARANYVLLNEIPARLAEHAARMKAEIAAERGQLTAVERKALVEAGIGSLEAKAVEAKKALDEAERALAQAKADLASLDREHDASVLNGDLPFKDAIELLAKADSAHDLRALYEEARATPSPQDDAVVRRIEATEAAIGDAEGRMGALGRELAQLLQRRAALEGEWQDFRAQGYDRPHGGFGNADILGSVLGGILGGIIQGTVLRDTLRDGYRRESGPWDSGFGGGGGGDFSDLSPFQDGGGSWGGGQDSGGWTGGGSDGGNDGFTTGGSI
jgi:uncharacterized membrane protein YgcG